MLWVAWRQHRAQAAGAAAVAAVIAVYAVVIGVLVRDAAADNGLTDCLAEGGRCDIFAFDLLERFDMRVGALGVVIFLPLLVGTFVGAPLVARELERGTHLLAWTQGVTRGHWLLTRVAVAAAGVVVSMAALTPAIGWLHGQYYSRIDTAVTTTTTQFDLHHLAPVALALATLGIGVAAGALLRRTLPAMAVTLALGVGLLQLVGWLRLRVIEPVREVVPFGTEVARPADTVVRTGYLDQAGRPITFDDIIARCPDTGGERLAETLDRLATCAQDAGIQAVTWLQPADRYWLLQGVNAGMLIVAGLLALAVAYWTAVRRTR